LKRWQADALLALVGLIWGFGFVAQKDASAQLGAFTFVACRFLISALFVLPLMLREKGISRVVTAVRAGAGGKIAALCLVFMAGVDLQQYGTADTTATHSAFLTGTYVVLVPFVGLALYRHRLSLGVVLAGALSLVGVGFLTDADIRHLASGFNRGDVLMLLCAVCLAAQVAVMGHMVGLMKMPFTFSFLQYASTGLVALIIALWREPMDAHALAHAWLPIVYAGVASGGIAYTLQAVAQQHTPSADSAIIMGSMETLFGAVGAAWLLHERMTGAGYIGAAAILASIVLVELVPYWQARRGRG